MQQITDGDYIVTTFPSGATARELRFTPEPVAASRHISVGAFFDRFGPQKYPILASIDPGVKALITDCSVRKFIDLDNPALPYGLAMLVAAGFAVVPDDITNGPIADSERV